MTNRLAVIMGAVIAALVLADLFLARGSNLLFLAQRFFELIEYIAFWR